MSTVIDNRYKLVRQLGVGGMGAVFEAEHVGVGRRVAVKLLHKTLLERDPSMLGRLQREARLAGSLDSPYIASVIDTGVDSASGSPYLVLEYLVGEDLSTLIMRATKLPTDLALRIAAQACLGLKKAHDAKIIHRDVKPANIFLARRDGEITVKILDFGIAKLRPDELASLENAALTRTGSLIGSPLYMSPEQARGMKTLDQRADVWSLGVVLFNMLTGRTPYESIDALGELILAICSTASPSVRDYTPEVPIEVAEIVQRALQIAPTERFQDAGAMHDAIMAKLDGKRTISVDALADFPEPPPGSRRFIVSTPAGPAGTEVLPSTAEGKVDTSGKSDPAVSFGSVSMTVASPSTDPGATPAPTAPPASNAPTSAQTAAGGSPDAKKARLDATPGATTTDRGEPLAPVTAAAPAAPSSLKRGAIAAAAALSIGALAAWLVSGKPSSGANTTGATRDTAAATGTATAAPVPSIAVEPVVSASPTPSEVPASTAQPSASAVEPATSPPPLSTGPVGRPTATGGTWTKPPGTATTGSAKPVDTSGFGDRK